MALNNVPLAGQSLSVTRNPINQNFSTINTGFAVDHIEYNLANQGMHKFIEFPTAGTPGVVAGKLDLYPKLNNAGNFQSGRNEVFVQPAGAIGGLLGGAFAMTAALPNANGWAYLPSGLILQWGTINGNNGGPNAYNWPSGAPFPTACLWAVVGTLYDGADQNKFTQLTGYTATQISIFTTQRTGNVAATGNCTFLAIGY